MITWRRVETEDFSLIADWLARPHVHRWWYHDFSAAGVESHFGPGTRGEEAGEDWLVSVDGAAVALMQRSRVADYPEDLEELSAVVETPPGAATLDYLIGDVALTGKGLGSRMIKWAVAQTWRDYPGTDVILIPVVADNRASWRALEKAGAVRVAEAELVPENPVDEPLHYVYRFDRPQST